jgi:hypothetical protein
MACYETFTKETNYRGTKKETPGTVREILRGRRSCKGGWREAEGGRRGLEAIEKAGGKVERGWKEGESENEEIQVL